MADMKNSDTNLNKTSAQSQDGAHDSANNKRKSGGVKKISRRSKAIVWLSVLLVVAIALLVGSGCFIYKKQLRFDSALQELKGSDHQLQNSLDTVSDTVKQQGVSINADQSKFDDIYQAIGSGKDALAIIQVQQLVKLADLKLRFDGDVKTALALLAEADGYAQKLSGENGRILHSMIINGIEKLHAVKVVDANSLYEQLRDLNDALHKLPFLSDRFTVQKKVESEPKETSRSVVTKAFISSWNQIRRVLIIRHVDHETASLITVQQQRDVLLLARMLFAQAQWAALQRDSVVYRASLQQINQLVNYYWVANNKAVVDLQGKLKRLTEDNIDPKMPSLKNILLMANKIGFEIDKKAMRAPISKSRTNRGGR